MSRLLKVYGSMLSALYVPETLSPHHQARHFVAATSLTAACRLLGSSRPYTGETGRAVAIAAAMSEPGTVFWETDRLGTFFARVPEGDCIRCTVVKVGQHLRICEGCKAKERRK